MSPSGQSRRPRGTWMGWRLRLLTFAALAGCLAMLAFIRTVASQPVIDEVVSLANDGSLIIQTPSGERHRVRALDSAQGRWLALDPWMTERSPRWMVSDEQRSAHARMHDAVAEAIKEGPLLWTLADDRVIQSTPSPLGVRRLGTMFWLMSAVALAVFLGAMVSVLSKPNGRNVLHALVALPQAGNLLYIGAQSAFDFWIPSGFSDAERLHRTVFDIISATALVHAAALHPQPLPWRRWFGPMVWVAAIALVAALASGLVPQAWWVTQSALLVAGALMMAQLRWSHARAPHPIAATLWRFAIVMWATLLLLTVAIAVTHTMQGAPKVVREVSVVVWVLAFASVALASPFLAKPHVVMREFSMLAGVSTIATALDLLFVAVFSLSTFASLALATFLALMVYAGVRQWALNHMLQSTVLTTERMFGQLYRIAREAEQHPNTLMSNLSTLLKQLFDPLELNLVDAREAQSSILGSGSTLVVPAPSFESDGTPGAPRHAFALRHANRGKRLFTPDDARLTDRVVEQLSRAVAFDQAVERGRNEERERIAQDLHDDIGARLLTMMYQSKTPEMEEYIRHTLQELKTLTRGLAVSDHRLSHAIAEWKADATHRLAAAHCTLDWRFEHDHDPILNVVQWSAITRILRELVTNAIAHGHATQVRVNARLHGDDLALDFTDDGQGAKPQAWGHGLGLGGIRKRVKQLQGTVTWLEAQPKGIACEVRVRLEAAREAESMPVNSRSP